MKRIFLGILIVTLLFLGGCGKGESNANNAVKATPTPIVKTSETAATDPALKGKIEEALKKKSFTEITVDVTTTPVTLRGTVPKNKLAEAMAVAMEANGGKPVNNQVTEK